PFVSTPITVNVSRAGLLDAWIDFNRDGDWSDPGEQIFANTVLVAGVNQLAFQAPPGSQVDSLQSTFARFRVSSNGGLLPTGIAEDGEVEDYSVFITPGHPPVVGDDPEVASDPSFITDEDTIIPLGSVSLLDNDSDPDGDSISVV